MDERVKKFNRTQETIHSRQSVKTRSKLFQYERAVNLIREVTDLFVDETCAINRSMTDTVSLLIETDADQDSRMVAILRGYRDSMPIKQEAVRKRLGGSVADLYQSSERLDTLSLNMGRIDLQDVASNQKIDFSRILITMVDDPRVVNIHLAELLVQMREAKSLSEAAQQTLAKQVLSVYTPLANKLGMWRFKWELEDLSFKYTNRAEFDRIAYQLDGRRVEREAYIDTFVAELQSLMDNSNIDATVNGRAKHLYGIWRKLNRKNVQFDSLFDVRAVRILVNDIASCYAALGAVHASWTAVENEFDDYISVPKPNGYQSLHTAIFGPDSKTVEVQIRTWQMHNDCEFGVAAHWLYKEDNNSSTYQEGKIRLLRQLMEWKEDVADSQPNGTSDSDDQSLANTYVFTPAGKVVELPAFSTPIDFAYAIHTEVGHRCRGARVNGRIVSLTYVLKTGDWVEIQTVKSGGPSRDWLSSNQNFVVSSRAKARIRRWFKMEEYSRYEAQGRTLLEKELAKHGLSKINFDKLALSNGYKNSEIFLAAIGMKELKATHAISSLIESEPEESEIKLSKRGLEPNAPALSILGIGNLLTNHASCCRPLPGDDVIGYVTVSRGVTIHKRDCGNIKRMLETHTDRLLPVDWEHNQSTNYPVDLEMIAEGRSGLLQEITSVMSNLGVSLIALNTPHIRPNEVGRISMTVEISTAVELKSVIARLKSLDRVIRIRRQQP